MSISEIYRVPLYQGLIGCNQLLDISVILTCNVSHQSVIIPGKLNNWRRRVHWGPVSDSTGHMAAQKPIGYLSPIL